MIEVLMLIKVIIGIWSFVFLICLYKALKRLLYNVPSISIKKDGRKTKTLRFAVGGKEIKIDYRSE